MRYQTAPRTAQETGPTQGGKLSHGSQHDCPRSGETPIDPTCKRCEEGCAETFLHRHWLCAGNLFDHPNEADKRAHQGLSRRAQEEAMDTPCLWFRGLLPAEYTTGLLPPPASEETAMVFGAGGASTPRYLIRNHPLYWYTDGSDGKYGQDARLVGNELADAFAEKGALLHEVPVDVVRAVSEADFLAVRIQKQLYTTAIQAVPELKGSAKAPGSREARRLTLHQLMAATNHDLLMDPLKLQGQWHCFRCGHTIAHKQLREWLLNVPCVPLLPTTLPDLFHACQPVLIGLQATHGSHKLAYKWGIWWCVAKSSWASSAARNLGRPCTGQATKAARDVLARLDKGLTPQPHVRWQSPHH